MMVMKGKMHKNAVLEIGNVFFSDFGAIFE